MRLHATPQDQHGAPQICKLTNVEELLVWGHLDCVAASAAWGLHKTLHCTLPQDSNWRGGDGISVNPIQTHRAELFFFSLLTLPFIFECHISLSSGAAYSKTVNELFLRPQEMKSLCEILHSLNLKGHLIYC